MSIKKKWETNVACQHNEVPVCPHCDEPCGDPFEMEGLCKGEETEIDCNNCGKPVRVVIHYSITYTTYNEVEDTNDAENAR